MTASDTFSAGAVLDLVKPLCPAAIDVVVEAGVRVAPSLVDEVRPATPGAGRRCARRSPRNRPVGGCPAFRNWRTVASTPWSGGGRPTWSATIELVPGQPWEYSPNTSHRGIEHVLVTWDPARNPRLEDRPEGYHWSTDDWGIVL